MRFIRSETMPIRVGVIALAMAYVLTGCATPGGRDASTASSDHTEQVCNSALTSLLLGLGCALVSSDKNRVRNGLLCSAAGYVGCMLANSYKAEQVKSAKEVESDYMRQQRKLPDRTTLASYTTNLTPEGAVPKGQNVDVSSNIVVIPGRNTSRVKIEEEIALVDSVGDQWGKSTRKQANPNGEAGQYRTSFTVPIHEGMSPGVYTVRKILYLDGVKAGSNDKSTFKIVDIGSGARLASFQ
jgi:hypothetical protein